MTRFSEIIPEEIRVRAAGELLVSSTPERYRRIAQSFAIDARVQNAIRLHGTTPAMLVSIADETWRALTALDVRDLGEVDLAILLVLIAQSASPLADELLRQVGMLDKPPLSWVSFLARSLSGPRASGETLAVEGDNTISMMPPRQGDVPPPAILYPGLRSRARTPRGVGTLSTYSLSA